MTATLKLPHRTVLTALLLPIAATVFVACSAGTEVADPIPDTSSKWLSPPPGWPLKVGDVVDPAARRDVELRFPSGGEHGHPQFRYELAPSPIDAPGEKYFCVDEPLLMGKNGIHDDIGHRVQGVLLYAVNLPPGVPCDEDAVYSGAYFYEGHVR